jgi:hypothetical protein
VGLFVAVLGVVSLAVVFPRQGPLTDRAAGAPAEPAPEEMFRKAQADGKYRMLLHQIKVEKDRETYKEFKDLGYQTRREYAGQRELSPGWWVYVAPYWYVWRDNTKIPRAKRGWGPEQATGEPDTLMAGDIQTAWAAASPEGQKEWLLLEYEDFITPTAVLVHETYRPGALYRVTAYKPDGEEVEVWKGTDPTATDADRGVSEIPIKINFKTNRIRIFLDSEKVPGWNEIDAVGLRDKNKKMYWAVAVDASSTYAPPYPAMDTTAQVREDRMERLEREVRELKAVVEELKAELKKATKKDK